MSRPTMPLTMRQVVAGSGLEEELVAKVKKANNLQSTKAVVEIASITTNNRCIQSSSSNHRSSTTDTPMAAAAAAISAAKCNGNIHSMSSSILGLG